MRIGFTHRPGSGGPGAFQSRFELQLRQRQVQIVYIGESKCIPDAVVVIGGTRKLLTVARLKLQGVPVVLRLDGILWLHWKRWHGLHNFVSCVIRNIIFKVIHAFLADHIVYQSEFVKAWWNASGWRRRTQVSVIHNGVDLDRFCPEEQFGASSESNATVVCIEGHIDYSPFAVELLNQLATRLNRFGISVDLYGGFANGKSRKELSKLIRFHGSLDRLEIGKAYRKGVYLSLDVNPACPNTVIEAMSSGLPAVGYNTGAISELVPENCGEVVSFGGDPWDLEFPDVEALETAVLRVIDNYDQYSRNARAYAEQNFNIRDVTSRYLTVIEQAIVERAQKR